MTPLHLCLPMADPPPHSHLPSAHLRQEPMPTPPKPRNLSHGKCLPLSFSSPVNPPNPQNTTRSTINQKKFAQLWLTSHLICRDRNYSSQIGIWTTSRRKKGSPSHRYHSRSTPKGNLWYPLPWDLDRGCLPSPSSFLVFSSLCCRCVVSVLVDTYMG